MEEWRELVSKLMGDGWEDADVDAFFRELDTQGSGEIPLHAHEAQ